MPRRRFIACFPVLSGHGACYSDFPAPRGEHAVTNSHEANLDGYSWPAKQASIRDDTSKKDFSIPSWLKVDLNT